MKLAKSCLFSLSATWFFNYIVIISTKLTTNAVFGQEFTAEEQQCFLKSQNPVEKSPKFGSPSAMCAYDLEQFLNLKTKKCLPEKTTLRSWNFFFKLTRFPLRRSVSFGEHSQLIQALPALHALEASHSPRHLPVNTVN